jgi:hypothetical protein
MRRAVVLAIACGLAGACGKSDAPKSGGGAKPYTHADPPFVLDVPAGFEPAPEFESAEGGRTLRFDGPHASDYLAVTWLEADGSTAVERRDSLAATSEATGEKVVAKGDLPGGGAWVEYEALQGGVQAYLVVGGMMVGCQSDGKPVMTACKTLRPK